MYPAVSDGDVANASICIPPLPEQRRIVAKIDSLSANSRRARDHLDRIPRLVEKYMQAILAAAFRGELTEELRTTSEEAWKAISVRELFEWSSGKGLSSKQHRAGDIPVIGGNGITGHHDTALIDFPTMVVGRVGAQCGNVHRSEGPAWITDNAIYAKSIASTVDLDFAVLFFRNANLNSLAGGTGQPYVNQTILNSLNMSLPRIEEQREIVHRINKAFAWINRLASEATSARKLIDHLDQAVLAKAFRGELVPQDPNDEPASALLERIRVERAAAPSRGAKVKRTKTPRRAAL
jgi:type I restriction enzyme S subunit